MAEAANVIVIATSGKTLIRWNMQDIPEGSVCGFRLTK